MTFFRDKFYSRRSPYRDAVRWLPRVLWGRWRWVVFVGLTIAVTPMSGQLTRILMTKIVIPFWSKTPSLVTTISILVSMTVTIAFQLIVPVIALWWMRRRLKIKCLPTELSTSPLPARSVLYTVAVTGLVLGLLSYVVRISAVLTVIYINPSQSGWRSGFGGFVTRQFFEHTVYPFLYGGYEQPAMEVIKANPIVMLLDVFKLGASLLYASLGSATVMVLLASVRTTAQAIQRSAITSLVLFAFIYSYRLSVGLVDSMIQAGSNRDPTVVLLESPGLSLVKLTSYVVCILIQTGVFLAVYHWAARRFTWEMLEGRRPAGTD